jgi:hypothetical protein
MDSSFLNHPLDNDAAAKYLGVKPQTLNNWRHLGRGPAYIKSSPGPRGRVSYLIEDLEAHRKRCRIDPEAS